MMLLKSGANDPKLHTFVTKHKSGIYSEHLTHTDKFQPPLKYVTSRETQEYSHYLYHYLYNHYLAN